VELTKLVNNLAEFSLLPCSASLISGSNARVHLNRIVTADLLSDKEMTRRESLVCDLNGRIISHLLHADLGSQILLIHSELSSDNLRKSLSSGIPWNEDVSITSGDGAIHRIVLFGRHPNRVLLGLGLNLEELSPMNWTEYGDCMISSILENEQISAFEILIPHRSLEAIINALEMNGATQTSTNTWRAIQSLIRQIDITENSTGNLPFELGLDKIVDLRKGCYPGQEIHARMESRGVLARRLVSISTRESEPPTGRHHLNEKERVEILSSHIVGDTWISLGLVSTKAHIPTESVLHSEDSSINVTVA
tara:strand:+ start:70 stop:993 length:924 start_codon:yes stop_codon:yes gene_type:complete